MLNLKPQTKQITKLPLYLQIKKFQRHLSVFDITEYTMLSAHYSQVIPLCDPYIFLSFLGFFVLVDFLLKIHFNKHHYTQDPNFKKVYPWFCRYA